MERKTFKTSDGAQLSYISAGQGKPIVMLHGGSQSAEQFKYQIPVFAEHYQVIAVDLRGHGESEKVSFGYRISRLSKDLQELSGALQLEKPHLLGHSMGCAIIHYSQVKLKTLLSISNCTHLFAYLPIKI